MFAALRRVFQRDPHANLKAVLGDMPLPTFATTTRKVLRSLRDPDTSLAVVGEYIAADPGLSVDVLRMVNSAAYGLRRPVSDAAHAARLLGHAELETLVLGVAVRKALPTESVPGFCPTDFWRNATRRAAAAKTFADAVSPATARQSFTASLLQDMALPLLAHANPDGYRETLRDGLAEGDLDSRERAVHGWDHAEVAGWLCETWSLPEGLRATVAGHHGEDAEAAIAIAGLLPEKDEGDMEPMIESARERAQLAPEVSMVLVGKAGELAKELAGLFQ